jgi:hypothetical protein
VEKSNTDVTKVREYQIKQIAAVNSINALM